MKSTPITHKANPNWGVTECRVNLLGTRTIKTSHRWVLVTCKNCLKGKPRQ